MSVIHFEVIVVDQVVVYFNVYFEEFLCLQI